MSESPIARIAWCPAGAAPICGHGLPSGPVGVGPPVVVVVGATVVVVVAVEVVLVVVEVDAAPECRASLRPPWHLAYPRR